MSSSQRNIITGHNMELHENIHRIKQMMGVVSESSYKNISHIIQLISKEYEKEYENYDEDRQTDYFKDMENLNEEDKIEEEEEEIKPEKKTKKQKKQEEEELYNKEWDDKVSKLHAHDLLTFKIKKRDFDLLIACKEVV